MSIVDICGQKCIGKCEKCHIKTDEVKELIFPADLEEQISNIIHRHGFINSTVERKIISNSGGNYLGILYEVNIKGTTAIGNQELNLFVKNIIPDDKMTIMSIQDVYKKEMYAYDEISKVFEEIQSEFDVPENERYKFVKCHGIIDKKGRETLILENMSKKGYTTYDRMKCMPIKFAELSVIELAKFHAVSFALQKFKPNYFKKVIIPMKAPFKFNEEMESFARNMSVNTLKLYESTHIKKKIEKFVDSIVEKLRGYYEEIDKCVLCHGDYRANNILMKEENGVITDVVPVDYQLLYAGNPLNDFIYFVFGASDQGFRRRHLTDLKNLYRNTMANFLKYFDIDLETWYPLTIFEQDYKDRLDYGLIVGINFLPIILAPEDDVPDFGETKIGDMTFKSCDVFKDRIQGIVDDFVQWGYL